MKTATWHGSAQEFWRLRKAISKNCSCPKPTTGALTVRCAAHETLTDQCGLGHVLYAYRGVANFGDRSPGRSRDVCEAGARLGDESKARAESHGREDSVPINPWAVIRRRSRSISRRPC